MKGAKRMATRGSDSKTPLTVHRLPITKARINLGAVVKRVHLSKEYFILEKDGIPIAGIMNIDEFEDYLELRDPKIREHIRKSQQEYLDGKTLPAEKLLEELRDAEKAEQKKSRRTTKLS
jgi:hypothetical protein